jgi:formamidopyrimidine-DNA glycosylase
MPEIAEVWNIAMETTVLLDVRLDSSINEPVTPFGQCWLNPRLESVELLTPFKGFDPQTLALRNRQVTAILHRGKTMGLKLAPIGIRASTIIRIGFGMTGRLSLKEEKNARARFNFEKGRSIYYIDPRKFGSIRTHYGETLGYYPFHGVEANLLSTDELVEFCKSRRKIRSVLTDQSLIVGLGNYMVNEILYKARIHPLRRADSLNLTELKVVRDTVLETILESVRAGGATLSDYYSLSGKRGSYQAQFQAYKQTKCNRCSNEIIRLKTPGSQSSFVCETCAPLNSISSN